MRKTLIGILILSAYILTSGQELNTLLATSKYRNYTLSDLSSDVIKEFNEFPLKLAQYRRNLLENMISATLLKLEAERLKLSEEKLIQRIKNTAQKPSIQEAENFYQSNRDIFNGKSFEEVKDQILRFLANKNEQEALEKYVEALRKRIKIKFDSDVNSQSTNPQDVIVSIGNKKITFAEFEKINAPALYEAEANFADMIIERLEEKIFNDLILFEAQSLGVASNDLIAEEITNKIKDFSGYEEEFLTAKLRKRLFEKYNVKILFEGPKSSIQNISTQDKPSKGNPSATVVIVMFSDFQCPACAATHPLLEAILNEYKDKVRLVVRNFPLVELHKNAFQAAQAAKAAEKQGKFFEYIEILYKNQQALDQESLKAYARQLGLDMKRFEADMRDKAIADSIWKDIEEGKNYGVYATPTIFVNGVKLRDISIRGLMKAIENAIENQ